jgi:hypothetical protein
MRSPLIALALVAGAALSCDDNSTGGAAANNIVVGQCSWPSSLDDPGPGTCHAARALVSCYDAVAGATCSCPSESPDSCASCAANFSDCHDECGANEYVVSCGGFVPPDQPHPPVPDPPPGCTKSFINPGGGIQYCCPCQ